MLGIRLDGKRLLRKSYSCVLESISACYGQLGPKFSLRLRGYNSESVFVGVNNERLLVFLRSQAPLAKHELQYYWQCGETQLLES